MIALIVFDNYDRPCYETLFDGPWGFVPWCSFDHQPGSLFDYTWRLFDDGLENGPGTKRLRPARFWDPRHMDFVPFPII